MAPARSTGVRSAESPVYVQLSGYGDAISPPPGLEKQLAGCGDAVRPPPGLEKQAIRPPPGLEPPCGVLSLNGCLPKSSISELDFLGVYQEFLQLRHQREECEVDPKLPRKPPGSFQDVAASVPSKPPGSFQDIVASASPTKPRSNRQPHSKECKPSVSRKPPGNLQDTGADFSLAFSPSVPHKPPGVFQKSGSKDSLASTAATLTDDVDDNFVSIPVIATVEKPSAVASPNLMQSASKKNNRRARK